MLLMPLYSINKMRKSIQFREPLWLVKLLHFEYWTWWAFYLPLVPYFLWYALKARSLTFVALVNPSMKMGGLVGESKIDILNDIADEFKPKTLFFDKEQSFSEIVVSLQSHQIEFPMIAKPNIGERGTEVEKINDLEALKRYRESYQSDFIIQEYIDYPIELGVMYYRLPNKTAGKVTSITMKNFLKVKGDGQSTVLQLLESNTRARFQIQRLKEKMPEKLPQIPLKGQEMLIEPIGNHCRGTEFINRNDWISEQVHLVFDKVSAPVTGFYYGRFDLKIKNMDDLHTGKYLKVMELNGVSSEPAHIYDAGYSLLQAYKDILYHWQIIWEIYKQNKAQDVLLK